MKNLLILCLGLLGPLAVIAQTTPPRGTSYQDSVRIQQSRYPVKNISNLYMNPVMDIVENLTQSTKHPIFLNALRAANLTATFKSRGPITLFLPSDSAFISRLGQSHLDTLLKPEHKLELSNFITYHAVAGRLDAKSIGKQIKAGNGEATLLTLSGSKIIARIDGNRNIVLTDETGGQSVIEKFNVQQSNGLIHLINPDIMAKNRIL
ncbi:fasciclin domain-containing protein [Mucilaginibacter robiniae]|uniref:Fasciclin domain-containing protein n=1 Tax=Mucilaginibacter robiniae TaxID=2728022 RepID=A0A7L5ECK1_9SPHI|nr:fasciclin domain-containing protein [Mucilaginibacter robiniae]QJD98146.1 fasciclin domain-containing protein [Mucilaginibacter robiniae]